MGRKGKNEKEQLEEKVTTENEQQVEQVEVKEEKRRKGIGINKGLLITAIVLVAIAIAVVGFALFNKFYKNVYTNVYLGDVNIGGKTEAEVAQVISSLQSEFKNKTLTIKYDSKELMELTPDNIDMVIDEEKTLQNVMNFGRSDSIISDNVEIIKAMFGKKQIAIEYVHSDDKLTNISAEITAEIDGRVIDDSYTVDEAKALLIIKKGTTGKDIVATEFKQDILDLMKKEAVTEYELVLENREPKPLDVDVVYTQVVKDAKDAYVDKSVKPYVYYKHEKGITFNKQDLINLLAKSENQKEGKKIEFKLTLVNPKVTIQELTKDQYKDKLGSYTSSFVSSDANRASNVRLAARMLNGTIVMPGETFSFNRTMGDCGLSSRGFKPAAVFKNGKVVQEVGGGICQISSTLYVASLYANMSIVSRSNHSLPVGYVPVSLDSTVYYPYTDFKFKNTRNYPIKIVATTTTSKRLVISLYGTKEDVEYDIVLTSWVTKSVPSKVVEEKDPTMKAGKTKVVQAGSNGYKSVAYKTVKLNGKVISKTLLSSDSYGSTPKVVKVGTKQVSVYSE